MKLNLRTTVLSACVVCATAQGQAPYAPFTAKQAELGKTMADTSSEVRKQIKDSTGPNEPFKILGNLYFVGDGNGEVFLLTSPQATS